MVIGHNQSLLNIRITLEFGQNQMKIWKLHRQRNVAPGTLGCLLPPPAFSLPRCCPPVQRGYHWHVSSILLNTLSIMPSKTVVLLSSSVIVYQLVHFVECYGNVCKWCCPVVLLCSGCHSHVSSILLNSHGNVCQWCKVKVWFLGGTRTLMLTGFAKRAPILHCFQGSETLVIFSCPCSSLPDYSIPSQFNQPTCFWKLSSEAGNLSTLYLSISLSILISSDYKSITTNSYRQEVGWR